MRSELGEMGSCSDGIWAETSQDLHLFPLHSVTPWGYGKGYGENSKLTSESGRLTRGAGAQQRFGTRLCSRHAPHCPVLPSEGFSHQLHHKQGSCAVVPGQGPPPSSPLVPLPCTHIPAASTVAELHPTAPHHPRRAPPGQGVLCRLRCGAGALCSSGWLPNPKPCPVSK